MNRIEYSTRHPVDVARENIAGMVAQFLDQGGQIQVIPGIEQRLDQPYQWNRNDLVLRGSSTKSREEGRAEAMANRIRELAATGAGITAISKQLGLYVQKAKQIAKDHGIEIQKAYKQTGSTEASRAVIIANGKKRRAELEPIIRTLSDQGLSVDKISAKSGIGIRTVRRVIEEYQIPRGRHE